MTDTLKPILCPACGKEMKKVFIDNAGINLDICTAGCGGIFFDNREFKMFDEKHENISTILHELENKTFTNVDTAKVRICPNCGAKMVKNSTSVHNKIEIDDCYSCGGKFLDRDELIKIRAEYDTEKERSEDLLKYVYSQIGEELKTLDINHQKAIENRSMLQKLFYKIIEK